MAIVEIHSGARPDGAYPGKRLLDILFVLAIAPFVLPLVLLLAGLVALQGGQPFFGHWRLGRDGRRFRMWKLRTMVPDADAALAAHLAADPEARDEWERFQKLADDPRVTPLGRLLRRTSLDELPQFWNVLRGDMSVVGPRPITPEQQGLYDGNGYYLMRPGVTGPWQVEGRNAVGFAARAGYDGAYLETQGPLEDARLILRTLGVVARPTGR